MIRRFSSIQKAIYKNIGQAYFFGKDNLFFKRVTMSKKQRFDNICKFFKLKKLNNKISLNLLIIYIENK